MKRLFLVATVLMATTWVAPARGEDADDMDRAAPARGEDAYEIDLDETLIVANRALQRAFEVGRSVDVVSKAQMERTTPESLPDALQAMPGLHSQKTNAGAGAPILRGLVGSDNLILLDGIRFNNSTLRTGPSQYLALIDPWSLARVEIIRGPGSVWYGSDAMGGVINAVTLDPRELGERMWGGSGRLVFQSATLGYGGSAQADMDVGSFSGYGGGTVMLQDTLRSGGGNDQLLSDYQRYGGRVRLSQELGGGWVLTEAAFWNAILDAGRVDSLGTGRVRNYDNDDVLVYARATRKGTGWAKEARINFSYHRTHEVMTDWRCQTSEAGIVLDRVACAEAEAASMKRRERLEDTVDTVGFFGVWEAQAWDGRLRLVAGGDGYFDFVSSEGKQADADSTWGWVAKERGNFSDGSTYAAVGLFVAADADVLKFEGSRLNVGGGVRLSGFQANADDVPGLGSVEYQHVAPVWSLHTKYLVAEMINLYVDFSQGFRSPNLQETTVLGNTGKSFDVPNDDLKPVRSNSLEVGAKFQHQYVQASVAGFGTWMEDVFVRVALEQSEYEALGLKAEDVGELPVYRRENSSSGFYKGVEGALSIGPWEGVSLWGNAAWIQGDIEDSEGVSTAATRIPPLMGAGGLRWENSDLGLTAEFYVKWAGRQDRLSAEDLKDPRICEDPDNPGVLLGEGTCKGTPGWVTLNARAGYALFDSLRLNLNVENMTDELYKYHASGAYAPGFQVSASVSGEL